MVLVIEFMTITHLQVKKKKKTISSQVIKKISLNSREDISQNHQGLLL